MRARSKYDIFLDILKAAGHSTERSKLSIVIKEALLNPNKLKK